MKIERVNENMIKVTITLDDLEQRNIDFDALNYNSPAAQELFLDLMEKAESEYGFTLSDSQLMIEPTPDLDEGFVITITKLGDGIDSETIRKYIKGRLKKGTLKLKGKSKKFISQIIVYSFSGIDDVCHLTKRLDGLYSAKSSLFKYRDTYYLTMDKSLILGDEVVNLGVIMGEYGKRVQKSGFFEGYLNEYGEKIISENALETLRKYF